MKKKVSKYNWIKSKKGNLKLFSSFLGAAFLFLVLTKLSQEYTQEVILNVQLTDLEDDLVIVNDSLPSVKVMVRSKGFSLLKFVFNSKKTISINAQTDTFKNNNSLFWDINNKKYKLSPLLGESVEVLDVKPDTIAFQYDILASKIVPVVLNKNITFSQGFDILDEFKLSHDSIKIVGSKEIINKIEVINTETFEQKDVNEAISTTINLIEVKGVAFNPQTLYLNAEVGRFTEGKFNLPIEILNVPSGIEVNIFPKKVDLIYYVAIKNFKDVKPEDFKLVCDFNDVTDELQSTLDIQLINSSSLVKRSRLLQNNVEFIISNK